LSRSICNSARDPAWSVQIAQVYGGGLMPIVAGQILSAYGVKDAYPYIGACVMLYAVAAIIAILRAPETKSVSLEV
jgi:fucose permease